MTDFKRTTLVLLSLLLPLCSNLELFAHSEEEAIWQLSSEEVLQKKQEIEKHRTAFVSALNEAVELGVDKDSLNRSFSYVSKAHQVQIPRSVLSHILIESMEMEIRAAELYAFCGSPCKNSLWHDLDPKVNKEQYLLKLRSLWPKIKSSFAVLWRDIPLAFWERLVHLQGYSKHLSHQVRYQASTYGALSMFAGAFAFSAAFISTEALESLILVGPLHFLCKANYIWSLAFGASVASLSGKLKSFFDYKDSESFSSKLKNTYFGMKSFRDLSLLEKNIIEKTSSDQSFERELLSRRDAFTHDLADQLEPLKVSGILASDSILWADVYEKKRSEKAEKIATNTSSTKLFELELEDIFDHKKREQSRYRWNDIFVSLRASIQVFKMDIEMKDFNTRNFTAFTQLKQLGKLQSQLDRLNAMMHLWLRDLRDDFTVNQVQEVYNSIWLRDILSEILSLGLDISSGTNNSIYSRLYALELSLSESSAKAEASRSIAWGHQHLKESLKREMSEARCKAVFTK